MIEGVERVWCGYEEFGRENQRGAQLPNRVEYMSHMWREEQK